MGQLKHTLFIPHWVYDTLKRRGGTVSDVVNFSRLHRVLSLNDLAGIYNLQRVNRPFGFKDESMSESFELMMQWGRTAVGDAKTYFDRDLNPIMEHPRYKLDVEERLFTPESRDDAHEEPFIIYDLDPQWVGVVVYPGFFTGEEGTLAHQFNLYEALLKALYVNTPFHLVAASHVFYQYLGLLSKKRIMV